MTTKTEIVAKVAKKWGWEVPALIETLKDGGSSMDPIRSISAGQCAAEIINELSKQTKWFNGCDHSIPAALRFLASNDRPTGGESHFNAMHLHQLAEEAEIMVKRTTT